MNAANELLTFIENSPSMFHSIETIKGMLDEAGFTYLPESARWDVKQGGDYYTIRNHSSIIAFRVGEKLTDYHFQMCASHSVTRTIGVMTFSTVVYISPCLYIPAIKKREGKSA